MKLTDREERAILEAIPVWRSTQEFISKAKASGKAKFRGETPDAVLAKHGIILGKCFSGDHRYGDLETELRRRATGEG